MVENLAVARGLTRARKSPRKNSSDFYPLGGGLNLIDSPLVSDPGQLQNALNYEIGFAGGYKRVGGYRHGDGRPDYDNPEYWLLPFGADEKPQFENTSGGSVLSNPYDQYTDNIRGTLEGGSGTLMTAQQDGGYGKNVLLYNTNFDPLGWDLTTGTVNAVLDFNPARMYQWTGDDATIAGFPDWHALTASVGTNIIQALNNPISVAVGDMLYISVLARYRTDTSSSADGIRVTLDNVTGNVFGLPASTPTIDFDVKRGTVVTKTDHFLAAGVEFLSDRVMRCWARTQLVEIADTSITMSMTMLREDPVSTWNTSFTQDVYRLHIAAPMAVVWKALLSPHNGLQGRTLSSWTQGDCTITDAVTTWTGGVYTDFSRIVEGTGSSIKNFLNYIVVSGDQRIPCRALRGDKIKVEFYVKWTSGQVDGMMFFIAATDNNEWPYVAGQQSVPVWAIDFKNGVVNPPVDSWTLNHKVESITLTDLGSGIYKVEMVSDEILHYGCHTLQCWLLNETGTPGTFETIYTGSGTKYIEMTGVRMQAIPDPDTETQLKEVVTKDTANYVNTGNLVLAGVGGSYEENEPLELSYWYIESGIAGDPVVEIWRSFGEAKGPATKNSEPNSVLDAEYRAFSQVLAWKEGELIPAGVSRRADPDTAYVYATPQRPPGSGPIRGVVFYKGFVYAFRDTEDGGSGAVWKSSGHGWRRVDQWVYKLPFDTGVGTEPVPGDVIYAHVGIFVKGVVLYVETTSGTWGTDAAGFIWVKKSELDDTNAWSGAAVFKEDDQTTVIADATTTVDYLDYETLLPGGKYEFRQGNLYGDKARDRLYWVNGEDTAYEWDGVNEGFSPIAVGMTDDRPIHLAIHNYHLFLAYRSGSIQVSSDGDPHSFTVILGATEIAIGDRPTGFIEEVSNSLLIFARNQTWVLNGNTRANFDLDDFNINAGGHEWSQQRIGLATYFDDRGFTSLRQTSRGDSVDYQENTQSELIQPLVEDLLVNAKVTTSHLIKDENIYRCYFDDGRAVSIGFDQHNVAGHMVLQYPFIANCSHSGEDGNGNERIFVGTMDGDVFELETGTSFNGEEINAFIRTVLYPSQTPGKFKRYSHIRLDGTFRGSLTMAGRVEFDYDDPDYNLGAELDFSNDSAGGYWDDMIFDNFIWDKTKSGNPQVKLEGEGTNCSIYLYTSSATDKIHTIRGISLQWQARRDDRRGL
jgi:hypothetical protein